MKRNPARMRYKSDSLSARLCLWSIVCNAAYFVAVYSNSDIIPDVRMGADVIINILFMLVVFWGSEMLKVYNRRWPLIVTVLALVQIIRAFWLPVYYRAAEQVAGARFAFLLGSLILSGLFLLAAAILSRSNTRLLDKYLRGIGQR